MYDADKLQEFVDLAIELLDMNVSRFHRIHLLALLGSAVAEPADTANYYRQADLQWQLEKHFDPGDAQYQQEPEELRVIIDELGEVVEKEERSAAEALGGSGSDDH